MKDNEIKLVQKPVISHQLEKIGAEVTSRIERLNIAGMLATEDTIQSMKSLRAELNKEHSNYEEQRKTIKEAVASPYQEFEAIYKTNISEKYSNAVTLLKDKIGEFETNVLNEKESKLRGYFQEYLISVKIDFLKFENLNLSINLSTTEKKYREQIDTYIDKVLDDLELIKTTEYEAEILAEYKTSLNVSASIKSVKDRKEREEKERLRLLEQEKLRRNAVIHSTGLKFDSMTKTWAYSDEIYVTDESIQALDKSSFQAKVVELEEKIKADKEAKMVEAESNAKPIEEKVNPAPKRTLSVSKPIQKPVEKPKEDVEILTATFEAKGTRKQLHSIADFMKENGITYKNI